MPTLESVVVDVEELASDDLLGNKVNGDPSGLPRGRIVYVGSNANEQQRAIQPESEEAVTRGNGTVGNKSWKAAALAQQSRITQWKQRSTPHLKVISPDKIRRLAQEYRMLELLEHDIIRGSRVPRDAQTERRCQMFSVFVTLISLLAIFFFAMTKPVWTTTVQPDIYKGLCEVETVIPVEGTAQCTSFRSRYNTKVTCKITCSFGVNEAEIDDSFALNGDGTSFNLTCDKDKSAWTYDVNRVCLSAAPDVPEGTEQD